MSVGNNSRSNMQLRVSRNVYYEWLKLVSASDMEQERGTEFCNDPRNLGRYIHTMRDHAGSREEFPALRILALGHLGWPSIFKGFKPCQ